MRGRLKTISAMLVMTTSAWLSASSSAGITPELTSRPNGPYRIVGNRIMDRANRPYLIRGTQLAPVTASDISGALSATSLITIRQRLNMNAVRLPVSAADYILSSEYRTRVRRLSHLANDLELLVIIETDTASPEAGIEQLDLFWKTVSLGFKGDPNVFFAPLSTHFAAIIRGSGAAQPVVLDDAEAPSSEFDNIVYQVTPSYAAMKADDARLQRIGSEAHNFPVLVNGLDPQLDRLSPECAAFPEDPAEAGALIENSLAYLDARQISWTISSFTAGRLITDYRYFNGTKLDSGWSCGSPPAMSAGIGIDVLSHLWSTRPLALFTVSDSRGGLAIARGGISTAYGPIFADDDADGHGPSLPTRLANVSIRITDSRGIARLAGLLHTGAGWSFMSFVVPDECAVGPAEVAVVRTDGSVSKSRVLIADLAPALFTAPPDGRSAAVGHVIQHSAGKPDALFPIWECGNGTCSTTAISSDGSTTVRLLGSGFRHAGPHPDVRVTAAGISVPVVSIGPSSEPGNDQITIRPPAALRSVGETDLYFTVNGELSNVVRIRFGSEP